MRRRRKRRPGATTRRRRAPEPPSVIAWGCVVLAVDTAARSGWAVAAGDKLLAFGEADTLDAAALADIVGWALRQAARRSQHCVLVLEEPWGGTLSTVVALGQARERWQNAWRAAWQPKQRCVCVKPQVWRGPVLGRYYVRAPREETREQEQLVAAAIAGEPTRADESPAICIARWAAHAGKVGRAIGKRAAGSGRRVA